MPFTPSQSPLMRGAASPSSYVEEVARRQWESLKKSRPGRARSRDMTPSRPTPREAAAELRLRMDEKRQRSRSRSRDGGDNVSENSDCNVNRAPLTREASLGGKSRRESSPNIRPKTSSIMAAAERKWEDLHKSRGGKRTTVGSRDPEQDALMQSAGGSEAHDDDNGKGTIPQHIITLLVQVCGTRGAPQDQAAEKLRDLMHDRQNAKLVAQEDWPLEALARPLMDGTDRSRVACAACFRHIALDARGSERIVQSPLILTALVTALRDGDDQTRQKAAAALGNLAWRSEASREIIISTSGVMDGLQLLLRFGPPPGRESALAALSNLTLNQRCTLQLAGAPEALSELVGEMLTGSAKGQLRAAGILRNLAAKPENRQALMAFPGIVPVLEHLAQDSAQGETQQRATKALQLLRQAADRMPAVGGRKGAASARGRATPQSLSRSSSPGRSESSSPSRPNSRSSSPPASAALRSRSRHTDLGSTMPEDGAVNSGVRRLPAFKGDATSPRMPVNSFSRRWASNRRDAAGECGPGAKREPAAVRSSSIETAMSSVESGWSTAESEKPVVSSTSGMSSPAGSSPAGLSGEEADELSSRVAANTLVDEDLVAALLGPALGENKGIAEGNAQQQLMAGSAGASPDGDESKAVHQVLQWIAVNGWEGIQERLFDLGETDFSVYSKLEPHMMAVDAERGVYLLKGHQVHLVGPDRHSPILLLDVESKRVLWDVERHTRYTFPLARKYMLCKHEDGCVQVLLKSSGKVVARSGGSERHGRGGGLKPAGVSQQTAPDGSSPFHSHAMTHKTEAVGPGLAESPGPVPQLSGSWQSPEPTPRTAAPALAKSPGREGTLNSSWNRSHGAIPQMGAALSQQRHQDSRETCAGSGSANKSTSRQTDAIDSAEHREFGEHTASAVMSTPSSSIPKDEGDMVEVQLSAKGARTPSNPELWRALMTEGEMEEAGKDILLFRGRRLTLPTYSPDGLATVEDVQTGEAFYVGPGRHEVFPPTRVARGVEVVKQLMAWANVHGWHDLSGRLLERGTTDYAKYAEIDQEMQAAGSSDDGGGLYSYRGRTLRLTGASRWDPERLEDVESGEVLWDLQASTKLRFPWARQALKVSSDQTQVQVLDRVTDRLLVKLELACWADVQEGKTLQTAVGAGGRPGPDPVKSRPLSSRPQVPPQFLSKIAKATGTKAADAGAVAAVVKLKDWAEHKGWFDLETRLLKAGATDYRAYGEIERHMQAVAGRDGVYSLAGRLVHVVGHRLDPVTVTDVATKEVLWDAEEQTRYENPWAREHFAVRLASDGAVQVVDKQSGMLVVQVGGNRHWSDKSDPLVLQSILINAVPILQRPGLEPLLHGGNKIVQVLKAFSPSPANVVAEKLQAQLTAEAGDLLLVLESGAKGWQLGRVVDLSNPDPLMPGGKEGWFPATYAAPVQELATWRGRVIQIGAPEPDGLVTVTDTLSGDTIFQGHAEAPQEEWNVSNAVVSAALEEHSQTDLACTPRGKGASPTPRVPQPRRPRLPDAGVSGSPRGLISSPRSAGR